MRAGTPLKQFRNSFNFIKTIHDLNSRYENGRHYQFCVIVLKSIDFHNLPDFRAPPTLQTRWYKRLPLMLRSHYIEAAPVGCPPPSGQTTLGKKKKIYKNVQNDDRSTGDGFVRNMLINPGKIPFTV